jgi:hypothetical protein
MKPLRRQGWRHILVVQWSTNNRAPQELRVLFSKTGYINTKLQQEMEISAHVCKSGLAWAHEEDDMRQTKMTCGLALKILKSKKV